MSAQQYHDLTSYQRDNMPMHFLDWQNQPSVFKSYPDAECIELSREIQHQEKRLSTILKSPAPTQRLRNPNLADLSKIFGLAYSITGKGGHGGGYHYYRSVASAGALYPVEVYVYTRDVHGLNEGLYHFSIATHGLSLLRQGDLSGHVVQAVQPDADNLPIMSFFLSAIFFRSAWKYLARSYRYHLLDTGHLLENLTVALRAQELPFSLSFDFDDHAINHLLGLDETKEVCLAVCNVPGKHPFARRPLEKELPELPVSVKNASIVSHNEIGYRPVYEIHAQGTLKPGPSWATFPDTDPVGLKPKKTFRVPEPGIWPEVVNLEGAFLSRRSRRNYVPGTMTFKHLAALINCLCIHNTGADSHEINYQHTIRTGLIVNRAEGIAPGFYLLNHSEATLGMVNPGTFAGNMAQICLGQKWLSNAAVHFVFLSNIEMLDRYYGARGYRYAMMVAGRLGQRLYLAATAMGLGCCGIGAFYDSEAAQLLGLDSPSRLLYLVAVGPVK